MDIRFKIVEEEYINNKIYFYIQKYDRWHGWKYICNPLRYPEDTYRRVRFNNFKDAENYIIDLMKSDNDNIHNPIPCVRRTKEYHYDSQTLQKVNEVNNNTYTIRL